MSPLHCGEVREVNGRITFVPDSLEFLQMDLEGFMGKRVEMSFHETRRSNEFNKYYWVGVIKVFMDFFNGDKVFGRVVDAEFVHDLLKAKFLGFKKQTLPDGEVIEIPKRSSTLTSSEFKDYVEYCKAWGGELFSLNFPDVTR